MTTPAIRSARPSDAPGITTLLRELGYPVELDGVAATLRRIHQDGENVVAVAVDDAHGVLGLVSMSCRPLLRLQGVAGTIEELAVRRDARSRGIGDRLLRYAKGLASERGWVRLETTVARRREVTRSGFFESRGFGAADRLTYRWSRLESSHPELPTLERPTRRHELV
jgi:N-acetylglutamate synthase-like GNAT family acetyltransferase